MYATISDLIKDLLGLNIPLPIQTFGFFMALSFMGAYLAVTAELKRKESEGLLSVFKKKAIINVPVTNTDYILNIIIGAAIGYKVLEMILDYGALTRNPQEFILSARGSYLGLIIGAAVSFYFKKKEADELKGKEQKEITQTIHPYQLMGNIVAIAAICGLLGAKIFHNLENIDELVRDPWGSLLSFSGLTFYGGLIVAAIAVLYYTGKHHIPAKLMIDATAPGLFLAYGIGRLGCHFSGDGDWGINNLNPKPNWLSFLPDWAWAYKYPNNVLNEGVPLPNCVLSHCNILEIPVYPTPLYEGIAAILLFIFLWSIRKKIKTPGLLFSIYLMLNGAERFLIEKIRINTTYNISGHHITQAELISSGLFIGGLTMMVLLLNSRNKTNSEVNL